MTKWQRIKTLLGGFAALLLAPLLLLDAELGCAFIVLLLGLAAALRGIRLLVYYASMARHMVGGQIIFFEGVLLLDFGLFTLGVTNIPTQSVMIYLLIGHLFYGLIEILRASELRRQRLGSWRLKLLTGAGNIALGILCLVQINSSAMTVYIYCAGVVWSALGRIISAFRRSAVAYVAAP